MQNFDSKFIPVSMEGKDHYYVMLLSNNGYMMHWIVAGTFQPIMIESIVHCDSTHSGIVAAWQAQQGRAPASK